MSHVHLTLAEENRLIHTPDDRAWKAITEAWKTHPQCNNTKDAHIWRAEHWKRVEKLSFAANIHLSERGHQSRIRSNAVIFGNRLIDQHCPPVTFSEMKETPRTWQGIRKKS